MIENTVYVPLMNQISQMKLTQAQIKQVLMQQMQVGNEIEGQLIEKDGQLLLKTKLGIQLPISLYGEAIDLGTLTKLVVVSHDEQGLVLKSLSQGDISHATQQQGVEDKVIKQLQLPSNSEVKESIHCFLEKQLPLDRQTLLKNYYLHHKTQLPTPVLVNILDNTGELHESVLQMIKDTRMIGKSTVIEQLTQFIHEQQLPKEVLIRLYEHLNNKDVINLDKSHEKEAGKGNKFVTMQPEISLFKDTEVSLMKNDIIRMMEERLQVDFERIKRLPPQERGEYVKDTSILEEVIQIIEGGQSSTPVKEQFLPIKEAVQQFNYLQQQGEMVVVPFVYQQQTKDAEIYFFKPKKSKKVAKSETYIVIALDMPVLQHLDIHLRQQEKKIHIAIEVENETIRQHVQKHIEKLAIMVGELGYEILQSSCSIKEKRRGITLRTVKEQKNTNGVDYKV